jgi:hypothetical protein
LLFEIGIESQQRISENISNVDIPGSDPDWVDELFADFAAVIDTISLMKRERRKVY